jgi:hypothetical protein
MGPKFHMPNVVRCTAAPYRRAELTREHPSALLSIIFRTLNDGNLQIKFEMYLLDRRRGYAKYN